MPVNKNVNGIDIRRVADDALAIARSLVPAWLPGGRFEGPEWVVRNPKRADRQPGSFKINTRTGQWADFASGDRGGDLVSLRAWLDGSSQLEAARRIAADIGSGGHSVPAPKQQPAPESAKPGTKGGTVIPAPREAKPEELCHGRHGMPSRVWAWRAPDGSIHHMRARYETESGREFCPWHWTGARWKTGAPSGPFPLYNSHLLMERPDVPVIVCEGEKAADAAAAIFPSWVAVTSGGSTSAGTADWSQLAGRDVIVWPDADRPGQEYLADVVEAAMEANAASIQRINPAWLEGWHGKPLDEGWDAADAAAAGMTADVADMAVRVHNAAQAMCEALEREPEPDTASVAAAQAFAAETRQRFSALRGPARMDAEAALLDAGNVDHLAVLRQAAPVEFERVLLPVRASARKAINMALAEREKRREAERSEERARLRESIPPPVLVPWNWCEEHEPDAEEGDEPGGSFSAPRPGRPAGGGEDEEEGKRQSQATILVELALANADFFHTPDHTAFADIRVKGHRETHGVRGSAFRLWLSRLFYEATGAAPSRDALGTARDLLEARARFDGPELPVHTRIAHYDGRVYLDLGDASWRSVEISPAGWRVVAEPPVRFRRPAGMMPLPEPRRGGSIEALRRYLNVRTEADFRLAVSWMLAALGMPGPYPILSLSGEQGTAKSTLSRLLRALIDPNEAPLRSIPREDRDLNIAARNGLVLSFDNLSGMPEWLSDALCRIATGGGWAGRQLYTDDEEVIFSAVRPIIVNGINEVATRPDLADRAMMLTLRPIPEDERKREKEIWPQFEADRPGILGALLDAVAHGLARQDDVRLPRLPRMADFAVWATACETAFWEPGAFMAAYEGNRSEAVDTLADADVIVTAIRALLEERGSWSGTAQELLSALYERTAEQVRKSKAWPSTPRVLSGHLRRVAPILRKLGIGFETSREGKSRVRIITLTHGSENSAAPPARTGNFASAPSASSAALGFQGLTADGRADEEADDIPWGADAPPAEAPGGGDMLYEADAWNMEADDGGGGTVRHNSLDELTEIVADGADAKFPVFAGGAVPEFPARPVEAGGAPGLEGGDHSALPLAAPPMPPAQGRADTRDATGTIRCAMCRNLREDGNCEAANRGVLLTGRGFKPDIGRAWRCSAYVPGPQDDDSRPGRERWPWIAPGCGEQPSNMQRMENDDV